MLRFGLSVTRSFIIHSDKEENVNEFAQFPENPTNLINIWSVKGVGVCFRKFSNSVYINACPVFNSRGGFIKVVNSQSRISNFSFQKCLE